jgi:hypothetical protein
MNGYQLNECRSGTGQYTEMNQGRAYMNGYPINGGRQATGPSEQASGCPAYKGGLDERY